ncbi:SDR family NAD(P)-dependent oxidoreductase [Allosaccharopolyspora coralli]|uniref:SDR family NAD(P)-dependent oxidoreductase n=1 Tax=Allosaccharopolyspora coralli TaxID=2665642 RepID=A0A5Q3Q5B8_9PSEU|nr:SDR family oxidoreductase [Allosaccharopolyspora coralli]QGK69798.1 SDR family NAD(P)-dependent oxidoreductase [Allosaccharopolyspora coralli]
MTKTMLITGASHGIGAATARAAAAAGWRPVLLARSAEPLSALAAELGPDTLTVPCDVTDWEQLTAALERAETELGGIDAVFANAGVVTHTSFLGDDEAPPEQWRDMVLTNVYGAAITARAALPALVRTRGHLLFTGSVAGRGIRVGNLYSATKHAVTALAQNIRAECVDTGVRVSIVQPGLVDTDMITDEQRSRPQLEASDVAEAVLYAVSQPARVDVNEIVVRPTGQHPLR